MDDKPADETPAEDGSVAEAEAEGAEAVGAVAVGPEAEATKAEGGAEASEPEADAGSAESEASEPESAPKAEADAGSSDAGSSDAGSSDAGSSDAGSSDAGSSEADADADGADADGADNTEFETVYAAWLAEIKELGEVEALEPAATPAQVKQAEEELDLVFPGSFKAFLLKHNGGSAHDTSLYGVSTNDGYDLAVLNMRGRREGLPEHLLGFAATPNSDVWCFDFSKVDEGGEAPVALIDVHQGQVIPACTTFLEWLRRLKTLEAELSEKRGPQPMSVEEWESFVDRERAKLRRLSKTPARDMCMPDPEEVRADLAGKIPVDPRHLKPRN